MLKTIHVKNSATNDKKLQNFFCHEWHYINKANTDSVPVYRYRHDKNSTSLLSLSPPFKPKIQQTKMFVTCQRLSKKS